MLLLDLLSWCHLLEGGSHYAGMSHLTNDRHFTVNNDVQEQDHLAVYLFAATPKLPKSVAKMLELHRLHTPN